MKRILLTLSLAFFCLTGIMAQEAATVLLISKSDKTSVGYLLKEKPVIVFNGQTFDVKYKGAVDSYAFTDIAAVSYVSEEDLAATGIPGTENKGVSVKMNQNCLTVFSPKQSVAKIFDASGKLLCKKNIKANSSETIELGRFKSGVHILSIDSLTFKFSL